LEKKVHEEPHHLGDIPSVIDGGLNDGSAFVALDLLTSIRHLLANPLIKAFADL
jgi:hypothetical protein